MLAGMAFFSCWCRSTIAPYFDDDIDKGIRVARDENGKRIEVKGDMKYEEWYNEHIGKPTGSLAKNLSLQQINAAVSLGEKDNLKKLKLAEEIPGIIVETLKEAEQEKLFNLLEYVDIPKENNKDVVFQTDLFRGGDEPTIILRLNRQFFAGKSLSEINDILANSTWQLANNIKEAIIHEIGHAKLIKKWKYASEIAQKQAELERVHIKSISSLGEYDGNELLAESEIVMSRNNQISGDVRKLRKKYYGE